MNGLLKVVSKYTRIASLRINYYKKKILNNIFWKCDKCYSDLNFTRKGRGLCPVCGGKSNG